MSERSQILLVVIAGWTVFVGCAKPDVPSGQITPPPPFPATFGSAPVRVEADSTLDPRQPLKLHLRTNAPTTWATSSTRHGEVERITADGLTVRWDYLGTQILDPVEPMHRRPSFVVDFDESSIEALANALATRVGGQPSAEQIAQLVTNHISTPEYGKFDIASRIAARGAGDCTEHAVLVVALARRFGIPARIVFGYVLFAEAGVAIGHAWAELHDGKAWVAWDTANPGPVNNLYLVESYIEDESPSFRFSFLSARDAHLQEIVVLGSE